MAYLALTSTTAELRTSSSLLRVPRRCYGRIARARLPITSQSNHGRRFLSSSSASKFSAGQSAKAGASSSSFGASPRFAYGLLASVAFFSGVLGYSLNEWTRRRRSADGAEGARASSWEDVTYASHKDVQAAIEELRKVLTREGAVVTVRTRFCFLP